VMTTLLASRLTVQDVPAFPSAPRPPEQERTNVTAETLTTTAVNLRIETSELGAVVALAMTLQLLNGTTITFRKCAK
jgi:hypothetical protein